MMRIVRLGQLGCAKAGVAKAHLKAVRRESAWNMASSLGRGCSIGLLPHCATAAPWRQASADPGKN